MNRGFTLIEVLVAVTILAMVAVVGALAINTFISSYARQERVEKKVMGELLFRYMLFKQLKNIPDRAFGRRDLFDGKKNKLAFVSRVPLTGRYFPGVFGIEYKVEGTSVLERDCPLIDRSDLEDFRDAECQSTDWYEVWSCENCTGSVSLGYNLKGKWHQTSKRIPDAIGILVDGRVRVLIPVNYPP